MVDEQRQYILDIVAGDGKKPQCDACLFFSAVGGGMGECVRHPPIVKLIDDQFVSNFPDVRFNAFCGEWLFNPLL